MTTVQIPASLNEATNRLTSLDAILTATGWERAAIVAAFVRLHDAPGQPRMASSSLSLSTHEFAALGIAGLRSKDTVRRYVEAWLDANDGQHPPIGRKVKLPTTPWPPEDANKGSRTTTSNIGEQIRANPAIAEAAAVALADPVVKLPAPVASELFRGARERAFEGRNIDPEPLPPRPKTARFNDKDAWDSAHAVIAQIRAADDGEWEPSNQTRFMWSLLGRALGGTPVDWDADLASLVDSEGSL